MTKTLSLVLVFIFITSCSSVSDLGKSIGLEKPKQKSQEAFYATWIKNLDPVHDTGNLPIALNSPLIKEGIVYAGNNQGKMMAYQLDNGKTIWEGKDKGAYHSRPVMVNDLVIYGSVEGRVYARDAMSGKLKYSVDLGSSIESPGVVAKGRIIFHLRNHKIFCLDYKTGKILWAYKRSVPFLTTLQRVSTPLVHRNKIYVGFADGFAAAFSLEEGILLWEQKLSNAAKFVDVDATPIMFGKKLLMGSLNGPLTLLNPRNGRIIQKLDYTVSRAPIKYKGGLILGTVDGDIISLGRNFKVRKKVKLSSKGISSMTWWKKKLAVSTVGGEISLVNPMDLKVLGTFNLGHANSAIFGELDSKEDRLAVLSSRNRLYIFR